MFEDQDEAELMVLDPMLISILVIGSEDVHPARINNGSLVYRLADDPTESTCQLPSLDGRQVAYDDLALFRPRLPHGVAKPTGPPTPPGP